MYLIDGYVPVISNRPISNRVCASDGREQSNARESDFARIIALHLQGLTDDLFIGKAIETEWKATLEELLKKKKLHLAR